MDKQFELDKRYLRIARIWSENSCAIRRQVGALIVKDQMIISHGYNRTPEGFENECEDVICLNNGSVFCSRKINNLGVDFHICKECGCAKLVTKPYVLHAEENALFKLVSSGNNSEGATLYVTDEPCLDCAKMIIQAGIKRVVFWREYYAHEGIQLLLKEKIQIDQISNID